MTSHASAVILGALEKADITADEMRFFQKQNPAGLTLFLRNFSPKFSDIRNLNRRLQALRPASAPPFLVAIDQEGGRVYRLRPPFPNLGPAMQIAEGRADTEGLMLIENYGHMVGLALAGLGFNINFAPVCDINTNPQNKAIGDRAFGTEVEPTALRAAAFLHGLQSAGVMGCLKHFPGQGAASADTHKTGTEIAGSLDALMQRELVPFLKILNEAPMVMMAHVTYPDVDREPASLSKVWIEDILRKKLGFRGVVVSDDMNMKAIQQDEKNWQRAIVDAVARGTDLLLVCEHLDRCILAAEALAAEAAKSPAFATRLAEAAGRVHQLRNKSANLA